MALPVAALAAIIAVAAAVAIAATVFAIYKLWKSNKKDKDGQIDGKENKAEEKEKGKGKEEDRGKDNDKTKDQKDDNKPKTKMFRVNGREVEGVLREDGKYHIDGKQLITKKSSQDSVVTIKNTNNKSIDETKQRQEEFKSKISDISKELETTKAKLAAKQQQQDQIDKAVNGINDLIPSMLDSIVAKMGNVDLDGANVKPGDAVKPTEDLAKDMKAREVKAAVTTSLTEANKAKEAEKSNAL